jgi:hypothetical protein
MKNQPALDGIFEINGVFDMDCMYVFPDNYLCNYPEDSDVNNILTTVETYTDSENRTSSVNTYCFQISKKADIVKSLTIRSKNITDIHIKASGNVIYSKSGINMDEVSIQPFKFGIPIVALTFTSVFLYISADKNNGCEVSFDYLRLKWCDVERIVSAKNLDFGDNVLIEHGVWMKKYALGVPIKPKKILQCHL